jgi:hypothetical protein
VESGLWKAYENWTQARQEAAHLLFQDCYSPRSRTAASTKLFAFGEAGTQVSPVTMSSPSTRVTALPCSPLFIKDPLKEDRDFGFLLWVFGFWLFALDFLVWEAFGREKNY